MVILIVIRLTVLALQNIPHIQKLQTLVQLHAPQHTGNRGNLEALMNIGRLQLQYSTIPLCGAPAKSVHLSTFNPYLA